jgi:hypothetical protein
LLGRFLFPASFAGAVTLRLLDGVAAGTLVMSRTFRRIKLRLAARGQIKHENKRKLVYYVYDKLQLLRKNDMYT